MKLKPCPFCGSDSLQVPDSAGLDTQKWWYLSVECKCCRCSGPHVALKQHKANGDLYAWGSRKPKTAEGQQRWDDTIDKAIAEAAKKWNKRI